MTSLQISCSDRNIFTSVGIRSTPGGFCRTGHSCCVCAPFCMLFRAHYGGIREVGKACHKPATKESPHSGSWTSLHWRTNCVSQLTFGEKVGPLVDGGKWTFCVAGGAHWSHPLTSRSSSLCPSFHHPEWGLDSHNLGIGSETLGSCCSSQTPGHTCHRRFSFQLPLPATDTRALA